MRNPRTSRSRPGVSSGNAAEYGGGLMADPSSGTFYLQVINCTIYENRARNGGGGIYAKGGGKVLSVVDSEIHHNSVWKGRTRGGGGFYSYNGPSSFLRCSFHHNTAGTANDGSASSTGGGLSFQMGTHFIADSRIYSNTAFGNGAQHQYPDDNDGLGGGIHLDAYGQPQTTGISVTNTRIEGNTATWGAGVYVKSGTLVMSRTLVTGNVVPAGTFATGTSVFVTQGALTYRLPLPPGHWLPNAECRVYREPCGPTTSARDRACRASLSPCAVAADIPVLSSPPPPPPRPPVGTPSVIHPEATLMQVATVPKSACVGAEAASCDDVQECAERTFVQPCDWLSDPSLLTDPPTKIFSLRAYFPFDETFPVCSERFEPASPACDPPIARSMPVVYSIPAVKAFWALPILNFKTRPPVLAIGAPLHSS